MRAAHITEAGGEFEVVDVDVPEPAADEVRVEVEACGICHSDAYVVEGEWPGLEYPQVPGHEVAGRVDAVGEDVDEWTEGDRVGVGWHGGHCFTCEPCRRGDFINCENASVTGISYDGGYAEYMTAPHEALAAIPDDLDAVDAAPLLCAGITTFNALRNSDARPGDLVAVQGVGGLGHLGIQYAHAAGFETVAVSRGTEKKDLALELGADHYVDSEATDPAEELQRLGGAKVILGTAPNADAVSSVVGGLGTDGELVAVGIPSEPIDVSIQSLVMGRKGVSGWPSGHARDSQDTLAFSALRDVTPEIETYPLEDVQEAYDRMIDGDARFRVVLEP
ncbi:Zinc-binding dehydrogenase [Halogranum amylolyticum]|uniref:Zinc-binding dehydrogenase n=1 Tax=Halogranum amylolyticum TaxID=660520 RepID=A0A1H8N7X5_9EURY|nr:alcohol dehydrogenase [Halogranum amylolyticum]SEO25684.1 Zinc-binding dehydrogenase [Halogranum amylolyticum]